MSVSSRSARRVQSAGTSKCSQWYIHQYFSRTCPDKKMIAATAHRGEFFEESELIQNTGGVGPEHHSHPDFAKNGGPLVNCCVDAGPMQGNTRCDPAYATSYNADVERATG